MVCSFWPKYYFYNKKKLSHQDRAPWSWGKKFVLASMLHGPKIWPWDCAPWSRRESYPSGPCSMVPRRPFSLRNVLHGRSPPWNLDSWWTKDFWFTHFFGFQVKKLVSYEKNYVIAKQPTVHSWDLAGQGSLTVAVAINDRWQVTCNLWHEKRHKNDLFVC